MFIHYLKIALRNLWRHRLQTAICLIGLSVGMTCFALSSLWLSYINSFEDFIEDTDRTYLLSEGNMEYYPDCTDYYIRHAFNEKAKALQEYCPEIEKIYIWNNETPKIKEVGGNGYVSLTSGPSDLYKILNLNILYGRGELLNDNEIIVPRQWAIDNFEQEDVSGKALTELDYNDNYVGNKIIVGVFDNIPSNTTLFNNDDCFGLWTDPGKNKHVYAVNMWVKLHEGVDVAAVAKKAADTNVTLTYYSPFSACETTENVNLKFEFLPLRKLRVDYPQISYSFNSNYVLLFCAIGLLVIFSALCNYFITMIAQVRIRCRALAIRRMLGSSRWGIVWLNVVETLLVFTVSALIGLFIIYFIKPIFIDYAEMEDMTTASFYAHLALYCLWVLVGCVALTIATTHYTLRATQQTILYGHQSHRSSSALDNISNIVQVSLSICIIFCVSVMVGQLRYLYNSNDLGYDRHNRISVFHYTPAVMDYIKSSPLVEDTVVSGLPIIPVMMMRPVRIYPDSKEDRLVSTTLNNIIQKEIEFWNIKLLSGRVPKEGANEVLINESMVKLLERDSIIGSTIDIAVQNGRDSYTITGIINNIYNSSVTEEPTPFMYENSPYFYDGSCVSIKVAEGSRAKVFEDINSLMTNEDYNEWTKPQVIDMETNFEDNLYKESLLLDVLLSIAGVSLIISLFGVFSLLSLALEQRRKEIALRKVHGATIHQILASFLKSQLMTLLISAFIAFPIGYIVMQDWLSSYIKQATIAWWLYPAIFFSMAAVLFATIFWRIHSAVKQNPADVIKNE